MNIYKSKAHKWKFNYVTDGAGHITGSWFCSKHFENRPLWKIYTDVKEMMKDIKLTDPNKTNIEENN